MESNQEVQDVIKNLVRGMRSGLNGIYSTITVLWHCVCAM